MAREEGLEKNFLMELEALEQFRLSYLTQYRDAPLAHDDPDVRRLIEAMAFFTARTRLAAMRSLDDSVRRIFRQHFPFLLGPVPAMAMLRATPKPGFTDAVDLPRGVEVLLKKPPDENGDGGRLFRFRTLSRLRILPMSVERVELVQVGKDTRRIFLYLAATTRHNQEIKDLCLHINHLDDARFSVALAHELRNRVKSATVFYEKDPRKDGQGKPCVVTVGPPPDDHEPDPFEQPLERARLDVRFPRRDLFLNVSGLAPPRNWQYITLCLDVGTDWPRQMQLTTDSFLLHTVPMINVRRDLASPIECDGTKDTYPVLHPDPSGKFALVWAIGAYKPSKDGFVPLTPGLLGVPGSAGAGSEDTYEITTEGEGVPRRAWASLSIQNAFRKPALVSVDGFWHQPELENVDAGDLKVSLGNRHVAEVDWDIAGPLVPPVPGEIDSEREMQLRLVSMKALRVLGQDDLLLLVRACGAAKEPLFAKVYSAITQVAVDTQPSGKRARSLKQVYELSFDRLESSELPNLGLFCRWLLSLLRAWSADEVVEVTAKVANLDRPIRHM
jgi:type VI secretion system protein ImpG